MEHYSPIASIPLMFWATLLLLNSPRVSLSGIDSKVPLLAGKRSVLECSPAEVRGGTFSLQTEQNSLPRLSSMFLPLESSASLSFGSCLSGVGPGLSAQRQDRLSIPLPLTHSFPLTVHLDEQLENYSPLVEIGLPCHECSYDEG